MIPCKRTKCLRLPICKSKVSINCTALALYFEQLIDKAHHYNPVAWEGIHNDLPNTTEIRSGKLYRRKYGRMITRKVDKL